MGLKDKLEEYQKETFMEKHGDRMAPVLGNVLSIKIDRKKKFFIWNDLEVNIVVKPVKSKNVVRAQYKKGKLFSEPPFMEIKNGNEVLIQGLKGEKGKNGAETINIMNIVNITNRTQLVESDVSVDEVISSIRGSIKRQRM